MRCRWVVVALVSLAVGSGSAHAQGIAGSVPARAKAEIARARAKALLARRLEKEAGPAQRSSGSPASGVSNGTVVISNSTVQRVEIIAVAGDQTAVSD